MSNISNISNQVTAALMALRNKWGFPSNLAGACGHGALALAELTGAEVWWGEANGLNHTWCVISGVIHDPTACQLEAPITYKPLHRVYEAEELFDFWQPPTTKDIRTIVKWVLKNQPA